MESLFSAVILVDYKPHTHTHTHAHTRTRTHTYHNQSSSDNTVPMKPFTNSSVHTRLVGGSSNGSISVKCHRATTGSMIMASINPTKPNNNNISTNKIFLLK